MNLSGIQKIFDYIFWRQFETCEVICHVQSSVKLLRMTEESTNKDRHDTANDYLPQSNTPELVSSQINRSADNLHVDSIVVYDEEEDCPYLPDKVARMPLRFPMISLNSQDTDRLLDSGFRRSGRFLYQTRCVACHACEAIRVDVKSFKPNRSQRRALKKGNSVFDIEIGLPDCDPDRVRLFNLHRNERGLNRLGTDIDEDEYRMFLVESCLDSFEMAYYFQGKLGGIAICDRGKDSTSAVYTYFDPDLARFSPGTFSIMKQIEYCLNSQLKYLYLGYFVSGSPHMRYKQNFKPHERLQQGEWREFQ